jgi:hypothetical protein
MKKTTTISSARLLALLAGLALASGAQAAATWTFAGSSTVCTGEASNSGCTNAKTGTYSPSGSGATGTLNIAGYAAANGSNNTGFVSGSTSGKPNDSWTAQTLTFWNNGNGVAMASDGITAPNHAIDNSGTNTEGVLLSFSTSQVLTSINLGYRSGDADISVWRYTSTNNTAPTATSTGASYAEMVAAGWQLVGNYGDLQTGNNSINSTGVGSSWWLITAYNSSYGAATSGTVNQGDDFFKIAAVSSNDCGSTTSALCGKKTVAEPGSLALAGLAIGGVFFSRRRKVVASVA